MMTDSDPTKTGISYPNNVNSNIQIFTPQVNVNDYQSFGYNNDFNTNDFNYSSYPNPLFQEEWNLKTYIRIIQLDGEAKRLLIGIGMISVLFLVELFYGYQSGSLALVSSGFHSLFDAIILTTSLISILIAKRSPTIHYSYGFERVEVISAFTNASFLIFISFYVFFESCERIYNPPPVEMGTTLIISLLGFIVHIVLVFFFNENVTIRVESAIYAHQLNLSTIVLRALIDAVGCLGVFIASWFIQSFSWYWADPLASLLISLLIAYNVIPVLTTTGKVLLQTVPSSIMNILEQNIIDVNATDGVHGVVSGKTHFWTYSPGVFVGTLCVRVNYEADEQYVKRKIQDIFAPYVKHLTIQIEKWDDILI